MLRLLKKNIREIWANPPYGHEGTPRFFIQKGDGEGGRACDVDVVPLAGARGFALHVKSEPTPAPGAHWALHFFDDDFENRRGKLFAFRCRLRADKNFAPGNAKIWIKAGAATVDRHLPRLTPEGFDITLIHFCPRDAQEITADILLGQSTEFRIDAPVTIIVEQPRFETVDEADAANNQTILDEARYAIAKRANFKFELEQILRTEPEARVLGRLANPAKTSLDIGANLGYYAALLAPVSKHVWAFEPNIDLYPFLRCNLLQFDNVRVFPVGLSDRAGLTAFHVPVPGGDPLAGCGGGNIASELMKDSDVRQKTMLAALLHLNDADINPGFVKIDVEGHERQALAGLDRILREARPNILIEIEHRHDSRCAETFRMLAGHKYNGYFVDKQSAAIRPLADFSLEKNQLALLAPNKEITDTTIYINNFIFSPAEGDAFG